MYVCMYLIYNKDLKRYYRIRTLYENNVEYEIGYVSQEIIHRYSHVLELFHQVQKLYDERPTTMFAPIKYVFNMYATVLEECKHIIHLCHMMNVVEKKYIAKTPDSIFKDPWPLLYGWSIEDCFVNFFNNITFLCVFKCFNFGLVPLISRFLSRQYVGRRAANHAKFESRPRRHGGRRKEV
ncbi:hypothetical protein K1T71_000730 [Dendrolimus kikuchii]|uniref:Uncharacterized protein n=1 Tax=Dendrolimus kikuchii TaxID=765133 RepID=A0ACC1DK83_9NEOP|nr:hypothetical protein K1T71_000730 [Dendrolimus kikuchii]